MFANVVRARVLPSENGESSKEVAIKIIRSQESMFVVSPSTSLICSRRVRYKAGQKEIQILNKLRQSDPEDKKHVVRLERTFEHRGHLCLVFESLRLSLSLFLTVLC
jgi:serine/threonine-protein kinase PRP4